jgi:hypothetical protein
MNFITTLPRGYNKKQPADGIALNDSSCKHSPQPYNILFIVIDEVQGGTGVPGSGNFVRADDAAADAWGTRGPMTLYLDYEYLHPDDNVYHHAIDTLVYRDNDVVFETFSPSFN